MAISLSDLTGASTSGNVLNEVNSYADFLDSVPRLVNKADPSGNTDAVQTVATKQPIALPLIDGEGYCYLPPVAGNYASTPDDSSLDITGDITIDVDLTCADWNLSTGSYIPLVLKYEASGDQRGYLFWITPNGVLQFYLSEDGTSAGTSSALSSSPVPFSAKQRGQLRVSWSNATNVVQFFTSTDKGQTWTQLGNDSSINKTGIYSNNAPLEVGRAFGYHPATGTAIHSINIYDSVTPSSSSLRFNCDFTSPRIPHGATEFTCETGQVVTVNTSGNNPAKVIKKSVLRYDGVDDFMDGVLGQTVTGGYFFAAFSVNGSGGESYGHILDITSTGQDSGGSGSFAVFRNSTNDDFRLKYNNNGSVVTHRDVFDDAVGDIMLEGKMEDGSQISKVNNADEDNGTTTFSGVLNAEEFVISADNYGNSNPSIDLEYLALFPASITDSQADQIRNFINNRNKVFYRWDTDGYYFFDGAATDDGQVFTGSGSWNGRIVGSDNGDSDFYISQNTLDDRPTTDGYKITFADNTDHFDIPSTTQAGWQIVGTSLGTFAYKVDSDAITELNLLGNAAIGDGLNYRSVGDLYGIILLPESATNRDIEEARKLLIDRGAADGVAATSLFAAWYSRRDIVEFKHLDTSNVTFAQSAWSTNDALQSFPALDLSNSTSFVSAWQNTSSLTQFPQGAKLGTERTNVNFSYAWTSSGLQSFPALDLSTGKYFNSAFKNCTSLEQIADGIKLGSNAVGVSYNSTFYNCNSLTSFPQIDVSNGTNFGATWYINSSLTEFPVVDISKGESFAYCWGRCYGLTSFPLLNPARAKQMQYAWQNCTSLVDFPAGFFDNWQPTAIYNSVFTDTWDNCVLSAQSVENILTSIVTSGNWATFDGTSGGTPISGPEITIDYNVATGSLTAATLSAIETLNGRGWSVNINNEIIVPNILQLQPAAAYSLRSFDADADPTVVNVRRSSDGSLSDFTASQVSDGTLRDWTLGDALALDGQRMHFDGIDDKVDVSSLDISNLSEITIKTRILWQNGIDANEGIFTNGSTSSDRFGLYISNQLTFYIGDGTQTFYPNLVSLNTNQYYDVVATAKVENGQMTARMFVDGVADNETFRSTSATDFSVVAQNWVIGYLNVNRYFKGIIDYVEVYEGYSNDGSVTGMTALNKWTNTDITNASWVDQVGSIDGTVSGSPALFSGQGFDGYVTTFYDQSTNGRNSTQNTASAQPLIVENGVLVTEGGEAAIDFQTEVSNLSLNHSDLYGQATLDSYYVTNATGDAYLYPSLLLNGNAYGMVAHESDSTSIIYNNYGSPTFYANGAEITGTTRGDIYAATSGGRKLVTHQGADTTNTAWSSGGVNFGNFSFSATAYGYTGKLQEMIFFNTDQSVQRTGIEKNINDHFNIY